MIYRLQKKLIRICGISVLIVFVIIFSMISFLSVKQLNETMDVLTNRISANNGIFPEWQEDGQQSEFPPKNLEFMTKETPFSTRFFTVEFDKEGKVEKVDVNSISAITKKEASNVAMEVYESGRKRGWLKEYRYKQYEIQTGTAIVFVDGSMNKFMSNRLLLVSGGVLFVSAVAIWLIVVFLSGRAVRPVSESYEKQKQFITDANHELKTPLTLVLTNLDILESEIGENEWLSDIRNESERMSALVNQLTTLARMDEEEINLESKSFSMSDMVSDVVSEFQMLAQNHEKCIYAQIDEGIDYIGDEAAICKVISILLDNAIKYCDVNGEIIVRLEKWRHIVFYVENQYADVNKTELERLFERFYRADKARTFIGGFGVGLSIAKAIVNQHKSEIIAYKKDEQHIGFKIVWK